MKVTTVTVSAAVLTGIGLLFVYSSSHLGVPGQNIPPYYYLVRQAAFLIAAAIAFAVAVTVPTKVWEKGAVALFFVSIVAVAVVYIPGLGVKVNGAQRWLSAGPIRIQPSEFGKLALVFFLARMCSRAGEMIRADAKVDLMLVGFACVPILLVGLQPDFGTAMVMTGLTVAYLFVSGIPWKRIGMAAVLASPVIYAALISTPYRRARLLAFLDPWTHREDTGFQLVQSYIALGSGGIFGRGLGLGVQKFGYLPESHTDFVFSVIGEELGIVGTVCVLAAYGAFGYAGYKTIEGAKDPFGRYLAFGVVALIVGSALFNLCVVCGLLPTKGMVLPFLSYGGSALVACWFAAGLLERVRMEAVVRG